MRKPTPDPHEPPHEPPDDPAATDINALVVRCIERMERDGESALEDVCTESPEHAAVLRKRMGVLRSAGLLQLPAGAEPESFPERLGDFRLIERLGEGGMGVVYLARQESLGREVALKIIRPEQLYFPQARDRFQREVETIARLQHPGIVPIYTVGEESGVPFFAMERVRGCTLEEVIRVLEGRDPAALEGRDLDRAIALVTQEPGESEPGKPEPGEHEPSALFAGTWTQVCVRILREVCEALEHAHRRGVIHRDLKPSNVIVTRDGRVMLLDFGLSSSAETARITRTGTLLGSLPYTAPERLSGADTEQDRAVDIYALGVTLYELLTLRLPFDGASALEMRVNVLAASPIPVRSINARASWDVETVCRVAMEPDPKRRYESAEALGRDLTNVLELRPLEARRASAALRARRWARRHPAWVVSGVLAALLVTGGPSVYAWQQRELRSAVEIKNIELEESNAALEDALGLADQRGRLITAERDRAERSFWQAVTAVEELLGQVGAVDLEQVPQMGPVQRELLTEALAFYDGFIEQDPDDRRLRMGRAAVQLHLGRAHYALGRVPESIEAYTRAVGWYEELVRDEPMEFEARNALAQSLRWLALSQGSLRLRAEQTETSLRTIAAYEALRADFPDRDNTACDTASFYLRMGEIEERVPNPAGAEEWSRRAVEVSEDLHARHPANTIYTGTLADALRDQGSALALLGRTDEAEAALRRSAVLARASTANNPTKTQRRFVALSVTQLASFLEKQGRAQEALPLHVETVSIMRGLMRDYPNVSFHHTDYLGSLANLSRAYMEDLQDYEAARRVLDEAEPAVAEALRRFSASTSLRARAAGVVRNRAALAKRTGDWETALAKFDEAIALMSSVLRDEPGDRDIRERWVRFHSQRAEVYLWSGDWASAAPAIHAYVAADPESPLVRVWAARYFARAARLAEEAPEVPDEDERFAQIIAYRDAALEALRAAALLGFDDPTELEETDDFDDLRAEPMFRAVLKELGS